MSTIKDKTHGGDNIKVLIYVCRVCVSDLHIILYVRSCFVSVAASALPFGVRAREVIGRVAIRVLRVCRRRRTKLF